MRLTREVREQFRRYGRKGGLQRAKRMKPGERKAVARRAATARWVQHRFGLPSFEALGLPGGVAMLRSIGPRAFAAAGGVLPFEDRGALRILATGPDGVGIVLHDRARGRDPEPVVADLPRTDAKQYPAHARYRG